MPTLQASSPTLRVVHAALSAAGPRPVNEDAVFANPARGVFMVVDGIGGAGRGDLASGLVESSIQAHATAEAGLMAANRAILQSIEEAPDRKGAGATVALVELTQDKAVAYSAGEVRIYHLRDGQLRQLTEDHTLAMQLVKLKQIKLEDVTTHPGRKTPLRYLGKGADAKLDRTEIGVAPGDVLLIASDGLYTALAHAELERLFAEVSPESLEARVQEALDAAVANDAQDNLSLLALLIAPPPPPPTPAALASGLRHMLSELLTIDAPAVQLAAMRDDFLSVLVTQLGAARGVVAALDDAGDQVLSMVSRAGVAGGDHDALVSRSRQLLAGADASAPVCRDGLVIVPLRHRQGVPVVVAVLDVAETRVPSPEALAPYQELATWFNPFYDVVMLRGEL